MPFDGPVVGVLRHENTDPGPAAAGLYGPALAAMWAGGVAYAQELAPQRMKTTSQALFGAVRMGLTHMCGAAPGGTIHYHKGGGTLLLMGGLTVGVAVVLFILATLGLSVGKMERPSQRSTS